MWGKELLDSPCLAAANPPGNHLGYTCIFRYLSTQGPWDQGASSWSQNPSMLGPLKTMCEAGLHTCVNPHPNTWGPQGSWSWGPHAPTSAGQGDQPAGSQGVSRTPRNVKFWRALPRGAARQSREESWVLGFASWLPLLGNLATCSPHISFFALGLGLFQSWC